MASGEGNERDTSLDSILVEKRGFKFWVREMLSVFMTPK